MPEGIIKYAVNSSLGKSSFIPIDELIKGFRHLEYSTDALFSPNISNKKLTSKGKTKIASFKFQTSGTIGISGDIGSNSVVSDYDFEFILEIKKNEELIFSMTDDYSDYKEYIITNVDVNDIISIYVDVTGDVSSTYPIHVNQLTVNAKLSDIPILNI